MEVEGKKQGESGRELPRTDTLQVGTGDSQFIFQGANAARYVFGLESSGRSM